MGTFLALLLGSLASAGVTIWATNEQNKATKQAGQEAKTIGEENKQLTLQQQGFQNNMTMKSFAEQVRQYNQQFGFQKRQYNNEQIKSIANDITNKANTSKLYQQQLTQMWGA